MLCRRRETRRRGARLAEQRNRRSAAEADRYRDVLVRWYGAERGERVRYAEAFEACEYGARLNERSLRRLFPFF